MTSDSVSPTPYVLQPDEGEHLLIGARKAPLTFKANPEMGSTTFVSMIEVIVPGDQVPVHFHQHEDEILFIHAGRAIITLGEDEIACEAGAFVHVPSGTWHGVRNAFDEDVVMFATYTPTGIQDYFRGLGAPAARDPDPLPDSQLQPPTKKCGAGCGAL